MAQSCQVAVSFLTRRRVKWSLVPLARKRKKEKRNTPLHWKEVHIKQGEPQHPFQLYRVFFCVFFFSETDVNIYNGFFPFPRLLSAYYLLLPVSRLPGSQSRGIKYARASSKECHRATKKHKNLSHTGQKCPASYLLLPLTAVLLYPFLLYSLSSSLLLLISPSSYSDFLVLSFSPILVLFPLL